MNLLGTAINEIVWYGWWWLAFVAIAYFLPRRFGRAGFVWGAILVSFLILWLDVGWAFKDMREHPEYGRDADFGFMVGVLFRSVFFNILLLPAAIIGLKNWTRNRRTPTPELKANDGTDI